MKEGGQEHFYLEPHAILCVPVDHDEMVVYSCTQCITKSQNAVAGSIGVPNNKVSIKVKRIGGGFGGKETLSTFTAARLSVAAHILKKPVKSLISREEDMRISCGRHPFLGDWKVSFEKDGTINAVDIVLYNNGGHTDSCSKDTMDRGLCHAHNSYKFEHFSVKGFPCRTNLFSNTAFRGFGAPQSMMVMETIIDQVAKACGLDNEVVREKNMMKNGDRQPYGQVVNSYVPDMWKKIQELSDYQLRKI